MFSSFPFLRYGHQTADIKPFPKLTSARLFSQEPRKKLSLRQHKASLKIFEDKACKVPIKSSFFVAFIALVKTLFISTSSLSHGDKPDRFSLLAGWRYGRAEFQRRGLGKRGHETWPKLAQKFPSVVSNSNRARLSTRHENAQMNERFHSGQALDKHCMMYVIVVFKNLRFRPNQ